MLPPRKSCTFRIAAMRRWLTAMLLVLLPLQSFWAAAATYCAHEQGAASQHFGHHEHRHHGTAAKADGAEADARNALAGDDLDCACCHLSCAQPLVSAVSVPVVAPRERWAPTPPPWRETVVILVIERPNWRRAARFGEPLRFIRI